jgi:hypothetical protein
MKFFQSFAGMNAWHADKDAQIQQHATTFQARQWMAHARIPISYLRSLLINPALVASATGFAFIQAEERSLK